MTIIQDCKSIVLHYFDALEAAHPSNLVSVVEEFAANDYSFRGVHPFNELVGVQSVVDSVWQPLRESFLSMQRRQDVFMAGPNHIDGEIWVASMGKFMGLFDTDWLGIPSTGKLTLIPYCEFHRIDHGRIAEMALWLDIISVMKQAGVNPLPIQTGADIINPGPRTEDGLLYDFQDKHESRKTLELILDMYDVLVGHGLQSPSENLARFCHQDMAWFGPGGIGATFTIERYRAQHQRPYRDGLDNIVFHSHEVELAEGIYGGWFGWPNLSLNQGEGFLGLPASDRLTELRVVDIYRRDGEKLAENWIFVDLLHYMKLLGVDVLERCQTIART